MSKIYSPRDVPHPGIPHRKIHLEVSTRVSQKRPPSDCTEAAGQNRDVVDLRRKDPRARESYLSRYIRGRAFTSITQYIHMSLARARKRVRDGRERSETRAAV